MSLAHIGGDTVVGFNAVNTTGAIAVSSGGGNTPNALMVVAVGIVSLDLTPVTVSTITDDAGNTWTKLTANEAHAGWDVTQTVNGAQRSFNQEIWYTKAASIGPALNVTVNFSATIDTCVVAFGPRITGYDPTHPFDLNASLPAVLRVNAAAAQTITGISTDTVNILPLWFLGMWGETFSVNNVAFAGVGRFDQDNTQHNGSEFTKQQIAFGDAVTGPYAAVSFLAPTAGGANFFATGVVVTADAQTPTGPTGPTGATGLPAGTAGLRNVRVIAGPTGPTGTFEGVRIFANVTGAHGLFEHCNQIGLTGPHGNFQTVYPIVAALNPTGTFKAIIIDGYNGPV